MTTAAIDLHGSEQVLLATVLQGPQRDSGGSKKDYLLPVQGIDGDFSGVHSNTHSADLYPSSFRDIPKESE